MEIGTRSAERAIEARYTVPEAASILARPTSTVRRWALGHARTRRGARVHDPALIDVDGDVGDSVLLSFLNLLELKFLASYRKDVPLQSIRRALDYAAKELAVERPLLTIDFKIHGSSLFLSYEEHMLNASERGQLAWTPALQDFIKAVDYDERERAVVRWWPLGREEPIIIDTRLNGGLPSTAASGVRTGAIVVHRREGLAIGEIAEDVGARHDEVEAALRFERVPV